MTVGDDGKCIYCRADGSSREHLPPSSLGGNCILTCVCAKCNRELGLIDQALAEHSPVALSKILYTPSSAFLTQLGSYASMHAEGDHQIGVRIGNQVSTEVRPQLFATGDHVRAFARDRDGLNDLIHFMDKQINTGLLARTRVFVTEDAKETRFLMHRSNDAVVSAPSAERGVEFLARLQAQWPDIKTKLQTTGEQRQTHEKPNVLITMSLWPNEEFRAVAKIAFETLALSRGCDFVLEEAFDPIRDYIKGDVRLPDSQPGELQIDSRFVQRLGDEFRLNFTRQHGVLLLCSPPNFVAFVILYGSHRYLVRLGTVADGQQWMRAYEFSYTKEGRTELDEVAFAKQILELSPEAFGISRDQAREMLSQINA